MYDWAVTGMWAVIVATVFPIYFQTVAAEGLPPEVATRNFALATALGIVLVALAAPVLGAITDQRPWKKRFLAAFVVLGASAAVGLLLVERGDWVLALSLFILVNIGANGSAIFYDALLPHLASRDELDRVSAGAFAVGYLGAGLLLVAALLVIQQPGWFALPEGTLPTRLALAAVGIWWAVFTLPLLLQIPEPPPAEALQEAASGRGAAALAGSRVLATLKDLGRYRDAALFLLAFLIYNDGIGTIIRMAAVYGAEVGIEQGALIGAIVMVQFVGVPATFLFGNLASGWGVKRALFAGLGVYMGVTVLGFFMTTAIHFFVLAFLVGLVQGGTQALSRSLFAAMIPPSLSGEFFGFFSVMEKFAGMVGPLIFALVVTLTGSSRWAILSIFIFFAVGALLLALVDVDRGVRQAERGQAAVEGGWVDGPGRTRP